MGLYSINARPIGHWAGWDTPTSPTVPDASPVQTTLPTSAYGQTLPVVWGKCRLPAAYIWCAPILTVTSTHVEYWDTVTTTTSKLTARLRFARPLVPNSSWTMRKLYANGKLIYDASTGYRQKGLKFSAYDGQSNQPRDPTMVREEGEANVSAHRGYLDIVVVDYDIYGLGAPPVFEAEWIQDGVPTHDYDTFTVFDGGVSLMDPDWDNGVLYGRASTLLKRFAIGAEVEYFSVDNTIAAVYFLGLRYSPRLDRIVYLAGVSQPGIACLINPLTGSVLASSDDAASSGGLAQNTVAFSEVNGGAVYVGFTDSAQIFSFYFTKNTVVRGYQSAASWSGYSSIQCVTPGEVRGSELDFWFCADTHLVKVTLTALGTFKSQTVVATLTNNLRYAVYDNGHLVVWTDAATVVRINGTTGATEYTKSVPYQIPAVSLRNMGDPDQHRLVDEFYFTTGGVSYFTNLGTGLTRSVSGAASPAHIFFYDGETETVITRDNAFIPQRLRIIAGDGTQRQLTDFLVALMEAGGYAPEEVAFEGNVDDLIDGAVVDVTAGVRDIARSICEPYSIAMFERAGKIIFKRALTDGFFAVDATISSTGDIADS
ncbi:MAG: hypothetical protein E5X80_05010 [Mesorhizobium sp.]|nr:MAG: hypothetical protein E5X80_05010 [Mesorhizobium sp.]